jgi:membrane-associated phospholipid phosphatase
MAVAGRRLIVLFLTVVLSLHVGTAHGFSLLPAEDTAGAYPAGCGPYTLLALNEQVPASAQSATPSGGQTYTAEPIFSLEFPKVLVRDVVYAVTSPARWDGKDWLILGAGVAGVAAVSLADSQVRTQVEHIQNASALNVASQIRQFGGPYSYGVLGLFLAGGETLDNAPAKAVFIDGAAATLVASGIIAPGLKYIVGRARPYADQGNQYFTPFSTSNASFPSGETTQAFAVASVIASHYDSLWVGVSSYGIASLVGMARIYEDAHWTSDALAGALIGTAVGTALVHFNDKRRSNPEKKTRFLITPIVTADTTGIGIVVIY